ncbi:MAG: hypothetical protein AAFO73_11595 [Pseudomonadota bacterium]
MAHLPARLQGEGWSGQNRLCESRFRETTVWAQLVVLVLLFVVIGEAKHRYRAVRQLVGGCVLRPTATATATADVIGVCCGRMGDPG